MARHTIQRNQTLNLSFSQEFRDVGWTISDGKALHDDCNAGYLRSTDIVTEPGITYTVRYTVSVISGTVKVFCGGTEGTERDASGTFTEDIVASDASGIAFFSDGNLTISELSISNGTVPAVTFGFNPDQLKWTSHYGYAPEYALKFLDGFFTFKNGQLWEHHVNPVRNNFYGQQYKSVVRFVSNKNRELNRVFYNLMIDGKGAWNVVSIKTNATDQFPRGMTSIIPKANFTMDGGKWWADFFRDMTDPAFRDMTDADQRKLAALLEGRMLEGNLMEIEMECDSTTEMKLVSVSVFSEAVERNF